MKYQIKNCYIEVINNLCEENIKAQNEGYGPFSAAICDENGKIIVLTHNTVMLDNCSLCHAEINAIKKVQEHFNTYDLAPYNLTICISAEPCSMCTGAIMWSGIKHVYYGVSSDIVEKITGFDEGYKPQWQDYFANKGIEVVGNIQSNKCIEVLENYMKLGKVVYNPS